MVLCGLMYQHQAMASSDSSTYPSQVSGHYQHNDIHRLFSDLKESDKVRLADYRARIVKESDPREPCDHEDLVFEKAEDESLIPASHFRAIAARSV